MILQKHYAVTDFNVFAKQYKGSAVDKYPLKEKSVMCPNAQWNTPFIL